jgi:hypothetical protein
VALLLCAVKVPPSLGWACITTTWNKMALGFYLWAINNRSGVEIWSVTEAWELRSPKNICYGDRRDQRKYLCHIFVVSESNQFSPLYMTVNTWSKIARLKKECMLVTRSLTDYLQKQQKLFVYSLFLLIFVIPLVLTAASFWHTGSKTWSSIPSATFELIYCPWWIGGEARFYDIFYFYLFIYF